MEAELVGIDDAMPSILWIKYFIEAQGYSVEHNVLHQGNNYTVLLAINGRWSSSKRTKHIKAHYLLVKDKIESTEAEIKYESSEIIWADVLTEPKQVNSSMFSEHN